MKPRPQSRRKSHGSFVPDELDLKILELLVAKGDLEYKEIGKKIGVDKRTVAKRVEAMKTQGVMKITADIDWSQLGVGAYAFVGTQTGLGEKDAASLYSYIKEEPRVIEAYSTVGSDEYFLVVVDEDLQSLREDVLRKLEPLTADLSTAIVSTRIKARNHAQFLGFLSDRKKRQK
jgi:DNA-binding Lrp family transcriptional regulator